MLNVDFELTKKELEKELAENTFLYRTALEANDNQTAFRLAVTRTRLALKLGELSTSDITPKNPPSEIERLSFRLFDFEYDV